VYPVMGRCIGDGDGLCGRRWWGDTLTDGSPDVSSATESRRELRSGIDISRQRISSSFNTVKTTVKLEVQLNKVETNGGPEYEGVSWIPRVARRPMTLTESDFFRRRYFF